MIRPINSKDIKRVTSIYNHYIQNTIATFEEEPVSENEMEARVKHIISKKLPWLVAEHEGNVIGYAYASPWKGRCAYRFSVEITVYLAHTELSRGWGSQLYTELMNLLSDSPINSIIAGIALPNPNSIALHEKLGMKKVAHFEKVGFKFDQWIDVGYWQKTDH